MQKPRFDFYKSIHKTIRRETCKLVERGGCTDFSDPSERKSFSEQMDGWIELMEDHASIEDTYFHPLLKDEEQLLDEVEGEHRELVAKLEALKVGISSLDAQPAAAHQFYLDLCAVAAFNFIHLEHEEHHLMPKMQELYSDAELLAVNKQMMKGFTPDVMDARLKLMLPAMNHSERAQMFTGIKASAPSPVFAHFLSIAKLVLSEAEAKKLADL